MSTPNDTVGRELNDCGCCEGTTAQTPVEIDNRPGLRAIAYRVGLHSQFKQTMLARLSDSARPPLRNLRTRDDNDFSIALLDAWATVADVLTFYQERIANESYLRTATERLSLLELARLIGYELRPGVAASAYLAFTLDDAPGATGQSLSVGTGAAGLGTAPPPATIAKGVKVMSVPGPGEQAQTFETVEEIEARAAWNAIRPRLKQAQRLSTNSDFIVFRGTTTNLKQGDMLLIVEAADRDAIKSALRVATDDGANTTRVDFLTTPPAPPAYLNPSGLTRGIVNDFAAKTTLDETSVSQVISRRWKEADLSALAGMQGWPLDELTASLRAQAARPTLPASAGVFAFRQRAFVFGHNAPRWRSLPAALRIGEAALTPNTDLRGEPEGFISGAFAGRENTWAEARFPKGTTIINLDTVYNQIVPGSWIVLARPDGREACQVLSVAEETKTDFNITAKTTRLEITRLKSDRFTPRNTTVYVQSEQLALADLPVADAVEGSGPLTLDGAYLGLVVGRRVVLTGERRDLRGVGASETLTLREVTVERGYTVVTFDRPLAHSYVRSTVTINANVALATHGESASEVLGSGDARRPFQRFTLRQRPLTYTSAGTPSGSETTLEVRVNDLLWEEAPTLYGRGPEERVYITRMDDDANTTVQFGDGQTGARLPTGQENVRAVYRRGSGLGGLVKANQLSQLMTRPLGVRGVTNPLASAGAEDGETRDAARRNAPLTVLTLDRVVSLRDYEDFASAFGGIDKALATWMWTGERRGIFVTVAGPGGAAVERGSTLHENLLNAMRASGDPHVTLALSTYQPRLFRVSAKVRVAAAYLPKKVLSEVERALREEFSFDARAFGQPVTLSEIVARIQNVEGVVSVDVDTLHRTDEAATLRRRLTAAPPQLVGEQFVAAELLTLDPRPLSLEVVG
jgi:predicted phage baseplate assembly protein